MLVLGGPPLGVEAAGAANQSGSARSWARWLRAAGGAERRVCQAIGLLANTKRRGAVLSFDDVATRAPVLDATGDVPTAAAGATAAYPDNGSRRRRFGNLVELVVAWRDAA